MTKALVGWKRTSTRNGIVLTLQLTETRANFASCEFEKVSVALNERQLRSLARDLTRAAEERGITLFARKPWWRLWRFLRT